MKKSIKRIAFGTAVMVAGILTVRWVESKMKLSESNLNRQSQYYDALLDWIDNMQQHRKISAFLLEKGYDNIAIYGKGTLGFLLCRELENTEVGIEYFVDQTADEYSSEVNGIPVIRKDGIARKKPVDAIIVTPIHVYDNIKNDLKNAGVTVPIISLSEVILEAK